MTKLEAEKLARTLQAYLRLASGPSDFERDDLLNRAANITHELKLAGWAADREGNVSRLVERRAHPRFTVGASGVQAIDQTVIVKN